MLSTVKHQMQFSWTDFFSEDLISKHEFPLKNWCLVCFHEIHLLPSSWWLRSVFVENQRNWPPYPDSLCCAFTIQNPSTVQPLFCLPTVHKIQLENREKTGFLKRGKINHLCNVSVLQWKIFSVGQQKHACKSHLQPRREKCDNL